MNLKNKTWAKVLLWALKWTAVIFAVLMMLAGAFFVGTLAIFLAFGEISALAAGIWAVISTIGVLIILHLLAKDAGKHAVYG